MVQGTSFASPGRASRRDLEKSNERLAGAPDIQRIIEALPYVAGVLNHQRQFVLANRPLLEMVRMEDIDDVLGKRPGEAIGCVHASEAEAGCGCSEHCRYCGAVEAVLEAGRTGRKTSRECRLTTRSGEAAASHDLMVTATPFEVDDDLYFILSISDISDQKRKRALERIFFHDIINTATTVDVLVEFLQDCRDEEELRHELRNLERLSGRLVEEIIAQRDLTAAESGDLRLSPSVVEPVSLLKELAADFRRQDVSEGKNIEVLAGPAGLSMRTDSRLLRRVIFNMLKNALEATPSGGTVTAGVRELASASLDADPGGDGDSGDTERAGSLAASGPAVEFWVHNRTAMTPEARSQVFCRSYSTKDPNRGLGTYSMKLLGERYLGGAVSFRTSEREGTTFFARFPGTCPPGGARDS